VKDGARIAGWTLLLGAVLGTSVALTACGGGGGGGALPGATAAPAGTSRPAASPGQGSKDDYGY